MVFEIVNVKQLIQDLKDSAQQKAHKTPGVKAEYNRIFLETLTVHQALAENGKNQDLLDLKSFVYGDITSAISNNIDQIKELATQLAKSDEETEGLGRKFELLDITVQAQLDAVFDLAHDGSMSRNFGMKVEKLPENARSCEAIDFEAAKKNVIIFGDEATFNGEKCNVNSNFYTAIYSNSLDLEKPGENNQQLGWYSISEANNIKGTQDIEGSCYYTYPNDNFVYYDEQPCAVGAVLNDEVY